MRYYILFFLLINAFSICRSQTIIDIEDAFIQINYNYHYVSDTTKRQEKFSEEVMSLRIGPTMSMFYPEKRMWADSLRYHNWDLYLSILKVEDQKTNYNSFLGGQLYDFFYKNYPKGEWTVLGRFEMDERQYQEVISVPEWELIDSVQDILGFECQMATSFYKGRHWTAFFTPEIPFSEGPWKLSGLPGLILKAYCENEDYRFDAISINTKDLPKVGFYDYNRVQRIKMTRDKFFEGWYKAIHTDYTFNLRQSMGATMPGEKKKDRLSPQYDFIETDYNHELPKKK